MLAAVLLGTAAPAAANDLFTLDPQATSPGRLFQDAAVERIRLALHKKGLRELVRVDANGKEAQASAMRMRRGLLERWTSPKARWEDAEPRAAGFLLGMQSPPP